MALHRLAFRRDHPRVRLLARRLGRVAVPGARGDDHGLGHDFGRLHVAHPRPPPRSRHPPVVVGHGSPAARRRPDRDLQRGSLDPRTHHRRRPRVELPGVACARARRQAPTLAARDVRAAGRPLPYPPRQQPCQGRQHQRLPGDAQGAARSAGLHLDPRRRLRAARRLRPARARAVPRPDRRTGADAAALLQSRPDPAQSRHRQVLSRRTALLLRSPAAGPRRLGHRLLLRHVVDDALAGHRGDRRLSDRQRDRGFPDHAAPPGSRLAHGLSQRAAHRGTRPGRRCRIRGPAHALVSRTDPDRARTLRPPDPQQPAPDRSFQPDRLVPLLVDDLRVPAGLSADSASLLVCRSHRRECAPLGGPGLLRPILHLLHGGHAMDLGRRDAARPAGCQPDHRGAADGARRLDGTGASAWPAVQGDGQGRRSDQDDHPMGAAASARDHLRADPDRRLLHQRHGYRVRSRCR